MTWITARKHQKGVEEHGIQTSRTSMIGPSTRSPKPPPVAQQATINPDEFDHLSGDGLRIKRNVNKDCLWIKGDGCRVTFATNSGKLRITGDGCRVQIGCNLGSVEYTGDGGHIVLGPESMPELSDRVVYKGDGGLIDFAGKKKYFVNSRGKEAASRTTTTTTTTTTTIGGKSLSSRADMRTTIVGSSNVQIHFNVRVHDKSSR